MTARVVNSGTEYLPSSHIKLPAAASAEGVFYQKAIDATIQAAMGTVYQKVNQHNKAFDLGNTNVQFTVPSPCNAQIVFTNTDDKPAYGPINVSLSSPGPNTFTISPALDYAALKNAGAVGVALGAECIWVEYIRTVQNSAASNPPLVDKAKPLLNISTPQANGKVILKGLEITK